MNNMSMLLLQMLPLLVFLVVDSIFSNTVYSIISAVVFAIAQMAFTFIKSGSPDYFILIDVALISGLSAVSITSKNDLFFKIKPLIIEGVVVIFFLVLALAPDNFLLSYFSRYMPAGVFNERMIPLLKKMMFWMCGYTLIHMAAIWYTALHSSRKVWAFVSGPGYFFVFVPVVIYIIFKRVRLSTRG